MGRPTGRQDFCSFAPQFGNNAPTSDHGKPDTLQEFGKKSALLCPLAAAGVLAAVLAGCEKTGHSVAAPSAVEPETYACGDNGFLSTTLYGAIATTLEWTATELACEGMPRPDDEGARLRFAGRDGDRQLAIIIALPALESGSTADEIPSNVTLIEEGNGRFFSTPDLNNCWTDITSVTPLGESTSQYAVGGTLYCLQPLAEVNGASSVSLSELQFMGLLDWGTT